MKKRSIWNILKIKRYRFEENVISILIAVFVVAIMWIAKLSWDISDIQWQDVSITPIMMETQGESNAISLLFSF